MFLFVIMLLGMPLRWARGMNDNIQLQQIQADWVCNTVWFVGRLGLCRMLDMGGYRQIGCVSPLGLLVPVALLDYSDSFSYKVNKLRLQS